MKLVCLGDSITYGYGVRRSECWVTVASRLSGVECINRGINGDTTGGMLSRFSAEVLAERPKAVLLMGGANDIMLGAGEGAARANITSMAHRAVAAGIVPLIGIPLPFALPVREDWAVLTDFAAASAVHDSYARWLHHVCGVFNFRMVDFRAAFLERVAESGGDASAWFLDGLHPTAEGHALMADVAVATLRTLFPKSQ